MDVKYILMKKCVYLFLYLSRSLSQCISPPHSLSLQDRLHEVDGGEGWVGVMVEWVGLGRMRVMDGGGHSIRLAGNDTSQTLQPHI